MIEDSKLVAALRNSDAITESDLERGLEISDDTGRPLYHTLIDHELTEENAAVRVAADLLNVPFVELGDINPKPEVLEQIPPTLAFRNMVFPLKIVEEDGQRELFLAMADPIDVLAMDEVATHTGIDIRPVLAGPRDLKKALERVYKRDSEEPAPLEDVEPFGADFDLEEISSFDQGSDLDEDSWEAFFDEAEDAEDEDEFEDSTVLSREMRDRRTSQELDPFEDAADSESSEAGEDEALQSLDEPLSESQMTGGVEADLSDWEIDERLEGEQSQEEKDYAAIGSFFVYSSEDARKERLQDLADFDEREEKEREKKSDDSAESEPSGPPSSVELEEKDADQISGVTSMSEAPFMFEDGESEALSEASDAIELQEEVEAEELDEDSGGHTMVGRGMGLVDQDVDEEPEVDEPSDEARDEEEDEPSGTSMLGGPFGIGKSEDSVEEDSSGRDGAEDSDGHTQIGGAHGAEISQAKTSEGEIDYLDDEEIEFIEDPSEVESDVDEEEDFGSQTQFGVGPQGPTAPADASGSEAEASTREPVDAGEGDSDIPLAQITPEKPAEEREDSASAADEGGEKDTSTKKRLSGLLSNIRDKNRKKKVESQKTQDDEEPTADENERHSKETAENPVAKAQRAQREQETGDDGGNSIRETRPNQAVTVLRAQAMQEDSGLASVFAKQVAAASDLSEAEIDALSELSSEELVYVTVLALFEKGLIEPRDILSQFDQDE